MSQEWAFQMSSDEFGVETFDGYDSREEAVAGIGRVKLRAAAANDGVVRRYEVGTIQQRDGDRKFVTEGDTDASPLPTQVKVFARPAEGPIAVASFVSTEDLDTTAFLERLLSACSDWLEGHQEEQGEWVGNFGVADLALSLSDDDLTQSLLANGIACLDIRLVDFAQAINYDISLVFNKENL